MLSSEFSHEVGILIRSLEQRVRQEPLLQHQNGTIPPLDHIERAIVTLVALHIALRQRADAD